MGRKVREQVRARKLRSQGHSLKQIASRLGVAKSSVSLWVRNVSLSKSAQQKLREREVKGGARGRRRLRTMWAEYHRLHPKPPRKGPRWPQRSIENFFDTWTPDMAYVLGYFAADGTMYKNKRGSHYIGFTSTDYELLVMVKRLMNASNQIEHYDMGPSQLIRYTLQVGSKKLYRRAEELRFTPNKSLTLKFPDVPSDYLNHFVRGYLDGDGCVYIGTYTPKGRNKAKFIFRTTFTCGSFDFLSTLRSRLHYEAGTGEGTLVCRNQSHYALSYSARDSRQLYNFLYPSTTTPCLARKRAKFEEGMGR